MQDRVKRSNLNVEIFRTTATTREMLFLNGWQRLILYSLLLLYVVLQRRSNKIATLMNAFKYDVSKTTKIIVFAILGCTIAAAAMLVVKSSLRVVTSAQDL